MFWKQSLFSSNLSWTCIGRCPSWVSAIPLPCPAPKLPPLKPQSTMHHLLSHLPQPERKTCSGLLERLPLSKLRSREAKKSLDDHLLHNLLQGDKENITFSNVQELMPQRATDHRLIPHFQDCSLLAPRTDVNA